MSKIVLLDMNNIIYRAWFTTGQKLENGTTYGTVRMILDYFHLFRSYASVYAVWDGKLSREKRQKFYPAYKSNREKDPLEDHPLITQRKHILRFLRFLPIISLYDEVEEADDLIGSIIQYTAYKQAVIVSQDKDFRQLLRENVVSIYTSKNFYTENSLKQQIDLSPNQWLLFRVMVGDPSDNLPGLSKIGKVKALRIIKNTKTPVHSVKDLIKCLPQFKEDIQQQYRLMKIPFALNRQEKEQHRKDFLTYFADNGVFKRITFYEWGCFLDLAKQYGFTNLLVNRRKWEEHFKNYF